jgi:hypothetical protein
MKAGRFLQPLYDPISVRPHRYNFALFLLSSFMLCKSFLKRPKKIELARILAQE